jgi:ubiquinone/menaquinone biosynthesis C-methylase UbiE
MELADRYYAKLLTAFVRGKIGDKWPGHPAFSKPLDELDDADLEELFRIGKAAELRLHKFKRKDGPPRVTKVLGLLQGLPARNLLDIGSGRGAFLWPLLGHFPWLDVTCYDILPHRVADINAVAAGGWPGLRAEELDITQSNLPDSSFDLVTMLEVLEHIPDYEKALAEVCRIAGRAILLSVPSKPDDNPEHINLFTTQRLEALFAANGIHRVKFHSVLNHIVLLAIKS